MRYELSDYEWSVINPTLPNKSRHSRVDDRRILNGIFWVLRSGARLTRDELIALL
jgi:transposase